MIHVLITILLVVWLALALYLATRPSAYYVVQHYNYSKLLSVYVLVSAILGLLLLQS